MSGIGPRSVVVVSGGLAQPSSTRLLADRITAATERHLREAGVEPAVEVIELREHAHELVNHLLTGYPSPTLQAATDAVLAADGLIAVTPIFSASYSGLFKLFFDVIERGGFAGKPVLIAATGGTARHSLALEHAVRPLFTYLRSVVAPLAVPACPQLAPYAAPSVSTSHHASIRPQSQTRIRTHRDRQLVDEVVALPLKMGMGLHLDLHVQVASDPSPGPHGPPSGEPERDGGPRRGQDGCFAWHRHARRRLPGVWRGGGRPHNRG